jgi:hypothetical protein
MQSTPRRIEPDNPDSPGAEQGNTVMPVSHVIGYACESPVRSQDEGQPESNPAPTATQPAVNSVGSSIGTSGGGEVYTGPVYGGGTISSSPN